MSHLIELLKEQTKELKVSFLKKTAEYAEIEYNELREFADDYTSNYDVNKEKKYHSLPACVVNQKGKMSDFIAIQLKKAERHYENSITKLALRIVKKELDLSKVKMSTSYLDPNISTTITDGTSTVQAYTIIAGGRVQRPHYRYLVK